MVTTVVEVTTAMLVATEARAQMQRMKEHWQAFWFELKDFHEHKGWLPLGYTSFKACVEQELGMSEVHAYRLLEAANMRAELGTNPGVSIDMVTERQLRELKPLEPEQRIEVARQIDFGNTSVREVREIVEQVKNPAHVSYNSGNNEWYTPAEYIEAAWRVMGRIDLDPASSPIANATVKALRYYTVEDDGLAQAWSGRVWMNPPYAGELIGQFTEKMERHFRAGDVTEALVLVNNATETNWFQRLLACASAVCFPKQRVRFVDPDGNSSGAPLQGQAVLYLGNNGERFGNEFNGFGTVLYGRSAAGRNQE